MSNIKIDLHTHSEKSHDGGLSLVSYKKAINIGMLDYIAITDHNEISFAIKAQEDLGEKIIVGEEIMTKSGEIIGLYLKDRIKPGLGLLETMEEIKSQDGLVYLPHPFETTRSGIQENDLNSLISYIDIIEVNNGRAVFGKKSKQASKFSINNKLPQASSSDTHGWFGWGKTYTLIESKPSKNTLVELLLEAQHVYKKPSLRAILYPKYNKIKRVLP